MSGQLNIGPFRVSPGARELSSPGFSTRLGDRAFHLLMALAERPGEVLSKRELLARVWPDSTVDEAALRFQIVSLRRVLAGAPHAGVRIVNAAGRGYMLALDGEAQAPPDAQEAVHNLPRQNLRLVGRDEEIGDVAGRLQTERLVTLAGPGGVGKTSIALAVASRLLGRFERVAWVDFSSVEAGATALVTAATALQIDPGHTDPIASIVAHLGRQPSLLVLDNCEHVIEPAATLAQSLLDRAPRVRILATSREPLRLTDEQVYRVRPLQAPPSQTVPDNADAILEYAAVELFAERARARSGYQLVESDCAAVATICRQLDGLPLAIELAAGWAEAFPPRLLAADLRAHLRTEGGTRTASARHRTLEAVLRWSYDRLPWTLQAPFTRLAVFRGEFDLDAAVKVIGGFRSDALAAMAELVAKSLVDVRPSNEGVAYRLLFMPRAFAEARLVAAPHEADARRRHAEVVLARLAEHEAAASGAEDFSAWLLKYGPIVDDLRAALDWALSARGDLEMAWRLAHDGALAWFRLSLPYEGAQYVDAALTRLTSAPTWDPLQELRLRKAKAILMLFSSDWPVAEIPSYEDAVNLGADRTTLQLVAWSHWVSAYRSRRYSDAAAAAERFKALSDPDETADQLAAERMIASVLASVGRLEEGRRGLEHVIEAATGRPSYSAATRYQYHQAPSALVILAHALWMQGDPEGARAAALRAVALAESTKHNLLIAFAIHAGLAHISILIGDPDGADAALDRLVQHVGDRNVDRGASDAFRAAALALRGDHAEAAAQVLRLFESGGLAMAWHTTIFNMLLEVLIQAGEWRTASSYLEKAFSSYVLEPANNWRPDLMRIKATLRFLEGGETARADALALLEEALAQARANGLVPIEARILAERTRILAERG